MVSLILAKSQVSNFKARYSTNNGEYQLHCLYNTNVHTERTEFNSKWWMVESEDSSNWKTSTIATTTKKLRNKK